MKKALCFLIILFPFISSAQFSNLRGRVTDKQYKPIPGAIVIILDTLKEKNLFMCETDSLGEYSFLSCPEKFLLNISQLGYENYSEQIVLSQLQNKVLKTQLEGGIIELNKVEIFAKKIKIKKEGNKFLIENISLSPFAAGNNVYNFLRFMPLLEIKPEGEGISILGRSNVIIYINGREAGTGRASENILKGMPAERVERIEILPIPGSTYKSGLQGGIINIVLKKSENEGFMTTFSLQNLQNYYNNQNGTVFLNFAGKRLNITSGISIEHHRSLVRSEQVYNYFYNENRTGIKSRESENQLFFDGYINLNYQLNNKQTLGIQLGYNGSDVKKNSSTLSTFQHITGAQIDSVYAAYFNTKSPHINSSWSGNLNYNLTLDDKGSMFIIDLNYKMNNSNNKTYSVYEKVLNDKVRIEDVFLQNPKNQLTSYGVKVQFNYFFDKNNLFNSGVGIYSGNSENDFFYGKRVNETYIKDHDRTNKFNYKDITYIGYMSYERTWSKKFQTVAGVRIEQYTADGVQNVTGEKIQRNEFGVFPSFSFVYKPNDKHSLSLDVARSILRPYYNDLNPFITYTSPTTYTQNNPYLKSSKEFEMMFSYTFLYDYMFIADYMFNSNLWNEFMLPVGDNMTRKFLVNYGNGHTLFLTFIATKNFFRNYWNISSNITFGYERDKGKAVNEKINITDKNFTITINNNILLSKKNNLSVFFKYQYASAIEMAAVSVEALNSLEISVMKQFKNASLSIGGYNLLEPSFLVYRTTPSLGFTINNKNYRSWYLNFSYTFGNDRIKRISKRDDENLSTRIK